MPRQPWLLIENYYAPQYVRGPTLTQSLQASLPCLLQLHYAGSKELPAAGVTLRAIDDQGIDIVLEGTKQVWLLCLCLPQCIWDCGYMLEGTAGVQWD